MRAWPPGPGRDGALAGETREEGRIVDEAAANAAAAIRRREFVEEHLQRAGGIHPPSRRRTRSSFSIVRRCASATSTRSRLPSSRDGGGNPQRHRAGARGDRQQRPSPAATGGGAGAGCDGNSPRDASRRHRQDRRSRAAARVRATRRSRAPPRPARPRRDRDRAGAADAPGGRARGRDGNPAPPRRPPGGRGGRRASSDSGTPAESSTATFQRPSSAATRIASARSGVTRAALCPGCSSVSRRAIAMASASSRSSAASTMATPVNPAAVRPACSARSIATQRSVVSAGRSASVRMRGRGPARSRPPSRARGRRDGEIAARSRRAGAAWLGGGRGRFTVAIVAVRRSCPRPRRRGPGRGRAAPRRRSAAARSRQGARAVAGHRARRPGGDDRASGRSRRSRSASALIRALRRCAGSLAPRSARILGQCSAAMRTKSSVSSKYCEYSVSTALRELVPGDVLGRERIHEGFEVGRRGSTASAGETGTRKACRGRAGEGRGRRPPPSAGPAGSGSAAVRAAGSAGGGAAASSQRSRAPAGEVEFGLVGLAERARCAAGAAPGRRRRSRQDRGQAHARPGASAGRSWHRQAPPGRPAAADEPAVEQRVGQRRQEGNAGRNREDAASRLTSRQSALAAMRPSAALMDSGVPDMQPLAVEAQAVAAGRPRSRGRTAG